MAATKPIPPTIYIAPLIHTPTFSTLEIHPEARIGVTAAGKIAFISLTQSSAPAAAQAAGFDPLTTRTVDLRRPKSTTFLAPGFIDTHTHAPQYPNTGLLGTTTLLSWLERYTYPMESSFSDAARAQRVYTRVVARGLSHGTTAAAYYGTTHGPATAALADICWRAGQRALVGRVCMDRLAPDGYRDADADAGVAASAASLAHCARLDPGGEVVRGCVTPRFAPACSGAALAGLGALQRRAGAWAQTHISENAGEIALVRELFPDAPDYLGVYEAAGLVNERMILAHAIHLTPSEIARVKAARTKISHCPASNTSLTSGALRLKHLQKQGVTVGLGTDMSGGYSPSILEMARQAMNVSRHVAMHEETEAAAEEAKLTIAEALYLATQGGAECIGLEKLVGTFEVGKDFDAQLIRLDHVEEDGELTPGSAPVDAFGWESWEDAVAKWVYTGDDRNVRHVWVRGRPVYAPESLQDGPALTT